MISIQRTNKMDRIDGYHSNVSQYEMPEFYTKNGKTPQKHIAKDGTVLVVNSTTGKPIDAKQMKKIENQHIQQMSKVNTADRLRAKLAERQAAKARMTVGQ